MGRCGDTARGGGMPVPLRQRHSQLSSTLSFSLLEINPRHVCVLCAPSDPGGEGLGCRVLANALLPVRGARRERKGCRGEGGCHGPRRANLPPWEGRESCTGWVGVAGGKDGCGCIRWSPVSSSSGFCCELGWHRVIDGTDFPNGLSDKNPEWKSA